ncbi:unnamed protein product [Callosobruchus maculatus]|uniref:CCHC-type domain-containing protein n=1 Tax=Callosobruchus maculatus TaxID=64391 RepID=A0A653C851_CALMS|nr:unnamed protein product [Callosobruchus maculatus]
MGRRRHASSTSSDSSDSDSRRKRSKKHNNENTSRKNIERRSSTPQTHRVLHSENQEDPVTPSATVQTRNRGDTRTTENSTLAEPASTSSVESRVERLEHLLEILVQQGQNKEYRPVSLRSDCIPEFNPENEHLSAAKWLEKVDQIKQINNWDDITTIYQVQTRLTGMARNWYHGLTIYPSSWNEWKNLIAKTFPDHVDYAMALRKMLGRSKLRKETMTTYYFEKMELLRTCQISGRNAVSCLIDGIPSVTIQNGARAGRYASPEALYEEYLSSLRDDTEYEAAGTSQVTKRHERSELRNRTDSRGERGVTTVKSDSKRVQCYNCKSKGHYQNQCPKQRIVCTKCNLLGHEASSCRVGTSRKRPDVASTVQVPFTRS